jgi:WXG100 family type VII secretion target
MSDDILLVNFARVRSTSDHIQTALSAIQSQLAQLEADAGPLVASWGGDAQQAYLQRQQAWRQASNDLATMLRDIKRALDESIADYEHAERKNAALFR